MEDTNDVVESVSSTEVEQQPDQSESQKSEEVAATPKEESTPFHLHPRFQEVINQKNQLAEQNRNFERQLAEMQQQLKSLKPQEQPKVNPIKERLKGIDPEFADYVSKVEKVDSLEQELSEFRQWKQELAIKEIQAQANSAKDKFYSDNSIPVERRKLYDAQLMLASQADPNLKISDLPKVLKAVHDDLSKLFQTTERETIKNYASGKKSEAAKPQTQGRGQQAAPKQSEANLSPNELRAAMIKEIMAEARSIKDI